MLAISLQTFQVTAQSRPGLIQIQQQVDALKLQLVLLEDVNAILNLQRTYGFMVDKGLWQDVAELFAEDGTLEIGGRGVFIGKQRVLEYMNYLGQEGPKQGRLMDHTQLQPIIHVATDGLSAKGRWKSIAMGGEVGQTADSGLPESETGAANSYLGLNTYENEYIKEGNIWKIKKLVGYFRMYTWDTEGWQKTALPLTVPEKDLPPDLPSTLSYEIYPDTFIPPRHFDHPVTGQTM
jgi:hypothetical protein